MKPNHPYTITFPIWKCDQWVALRGRLKLTDEQVVIARWNNPTYLDQELQFLESQYRIKPQIETKLIKPQTCLLPSILQIIRTNTYTDVVIDNCTQWQLLSGDLSTLLLIYFGYDLFQGQPPRDCTIENIIKNGDQIVILDFGLRKRTENYCIYWNPLILKGKQCHSSYQWSLGILFLVLTQGTYILNEIQKHVNEWLKGNRLDIASLVASKKPSVIHLISSLLNLENPISWNQIPHHPAFREDFACKQILKEYSIRYNRSELKARSSSRLSSRDDTNPSFTIMPQPYGIKNNQQNEQGNLNLSLITKVSNLYKLHQDKVRNAVVTKYSSVQSRQTTTSQNRSQQQLQNTYSQKFNNFFSTTKLLTKVQLKQQNNSTGLKSYRNQTQNTTGNQQDSYRKSEEITDMNQTSNGRYLIQQQTTKKEFFNDKIQNKISQIRGTQIKMQQKSRNGSQKSIELDKKSYNNQISQTQDEIQDLYQQSEKAMEQYKAHYSQDFEKEKQNESDESRISHAENYIQLIKRPISNLSIFSQKYTRGLDAINIIGQTVAKCLTYFNALQNFWVIPLFLIFKRMLQLRKQIENILETKKNELDLLDWEIILQSEEYEIYKNKVISDNNLVYNELILLLNQAKIKAQKLGKTRSEKVEWFLNEDINDNIKDVCYTYFYGQVYKNIKDKKGIEKPIIDWLKLQVQAQTALIIFELPPLICEKGNFSYEQYLSIMESDDDSKVLQYLKKNEQYLERK